MITKLDYLRMGLQGTFVQNYNGEATCPIANLEVSDPTEETWEIPVN